MSFILSTDNIKCVEGFILHLAVIRVGDIFLPEEVIVTTSSGTAKEGVDFKRVWEHFFFRKGERQKNFEIEIYKDLELEFPETFTVQLLQFPQQGIQGQLGTPDKCIVTIIDDNP